MKYLFLSALVLFINMGNAQASASRDCDVIAILETTKESGVYLIKIGKAKDKATGKPCFMHFINKQIAKIDGENVVTDKPVELQYNSSSAMGENGPVSSTSWKYIDEYSREDAIEDALAEEGSNDSAAQ